MAYSVVVYAYASLLWRYMDIEIEFTDEAEEEQGQEAAQKQQEGGVEIVEEETGPPFYAQEDSTFIPLTWSRKLPRSFYRGSDPEWQEFIRFANDRPRHKKAQDQLVQIVYTGSTQHPTISRHIGMDPKVGKYWLDISFPDGPPQEYERSGIEIGDGFVAWSQQKVDSEQQWRWQRALWPEAAAGGVWATGKVLVGMNWRRLKRGLGIEGADEMASPQERMRAALEAVEKRSAEAAGGVGKKTQQTEPNGSPADAVARRTSEVDSSPPSSSSPDRTGERPRATPPPDRPTISGLNIPLPSVPLPPFTQGPKPSQQSPGPISPHDLPPVSHDLPIALHVFRHSLAKAWNPKKPELPRGTVLIQGLVEVKGARGRILFDVESAYDPRQGKFMQVNAGVRGVKKWKQSPRGGP